MSLVPAFPLARAGRPTPSLLHAATALAFAALAAGCQAERPPPPALGFQGLPVAGARSDAVAAGFDRCIYVDAVSVRCRKAGVTLFGAGPYQAAVDLLGKDGRSGFDHVTIWHDRDQRALYRAVEAMAKSGWTLCYTGTDRGGDQAIFSRPGDPVRIYMDISYWGKRRIRIYPTALAPKPSTACLPNKSLGLLGLDVGT
jgi:hypothetical protein